MRAIQRVYTRAGILRSHIPQPREYTRREQGVCLCQPAHGKVFLPRRAGAETIERPDQSVEAPAYFFQFASALSGVTIPSAINF